MNRTPLKWDLLRVFLAVARSGSHVRAARLLGVNHSTVFRRMGELDHAAGSPLFERTPEGYLLTEAGEQILPAAERAETEMLSIERTLTDAGTGLAGTIRVTTSDDLAARYLAPRLAKFHALYPEVTIELLTDNHLLDLLRREADVAIRPHSPPHGPLVGPATVEMVHAVYCAKAYAESHGVPRAAAELQDHWICTYDGSLAFFDAAKWMERRGKAARVAARFNSTMSLAAAVKAGMGLAVLPRYVGDNDPELIKAFDLGTSLDTRICVLTHPDIRKVARIRAFMKYAEEMLLADREYFEGLA